MQPSVFWFTPSPAIVLLFLPLWCWYSQLGTIFHGKGTTSKVRFFSIRPQKVEVPQQNLQKITAISKTMQPALLEHNSHFRFSTVPRLGEVLISSRERYIFCFESRCAGQGLLCNSQLAQWSRQNKRSLPHFMQMFNLRLKAAFVHSGPVKRKGMGAVYTLTLPWVGWQGGTESASLCIDLSIVTAHHSLRTGDGKDTGDL